MPFLNFNTKNKVKIWDGINGALFHSDKITIGHMTIDEGTPLPEHHHPHEQWLNVIEGDLELTVGGETQCWGWGWEHIFLPMFPIQEWH